MSDFCKISLSDRNVSRPTSPVTETTRPKSPVPRQTCPHWFCRSRKSRWPGPSRKALEEFSVHSHLLPVIKALHSCSEVCLRASSIQVKTVHGEWWTPTRVCAVTTPLHRLHELDRQWQPCQWVCYCWKLIKCLFLGDGLVLLVATDQGLRHATDRFVAACDQGGMRFNTKTTEIAPL